ncbi:MAG: germination protein Ger(x)C family [Anaerosporomusa subterranea]|nr:germination protein Ger(x)C family [Anaerosporomusa subterranea]
MLRIVMVVSLLVVSLLSGGCVNGRETDEVTYVVAIGLDKGTGKNIRATYVVVSTGTMGGGGKEGEAGGKQTELVTIEAANLGEARNLLNSVESRSINLSHVKGFIVGEDLARQGLADIMSVVMRFREFRGTMYIGVVNNGTAEEFLSKNSPKVEKLPSKYFESMIATADESSYYLPVQMHEFYRRLKTNNGSPTAMLVGVNPQTGRGQPQGIVEEGDKAKEYTAGMMPREGESNPAEIMGTALFVDDKMVGTLTNQETRMVAILRGKFGRGFMVVADPMAQEKNANVYLRLGRLPRIKCEFQDGIPKINADILLEAEISALPSGVNYEAPEYSGMLESQVSRVIEEEMSNMLRKTQELGSDAVGFGRYARSQFTLYDEFAQLDFKKLYQKAEITLSVKTIIRRTGLLWKTSPLPGKDKGTEKKREVS